MEYTNRYLEHLKAKERQARAEAEEHIRQAEAERVKREFLGNARDDDEELRLSVLRSMLAYRVVYAFMRRALPDEMFRRRYPEMCR